jgi:uncharacterized membrane protein
MVIKSDTTTIVTAPKLDIGSQPSLQRWLKHFFYMPESKRFFNQQDQYAITQAVTEAEHGHVGEIQVVIEGHIPAHQAYFQNVQARARQLFAELGVWDTEYNSGVLLYINLCERNVEIVIDRGIKSATAQEDWEKICQLITADLKAQKYREAVVQGILHIGEILNQYYANYTADKENEIVNTPLIL